MCPQVHESALVMSSVCNAASCYVMLSSQHVSSSVVVSRQERVTDHRRHAQDESTVEREWNGLANPDIR